MLNSRIDLLCRYLGNVTEPISDELKSTQLNHLMEKVRMEFDVGASLSAHSSHSTPPQQVNSEGHHMKRISHIAAALFIVAAVGTSVQAEEGWTSLFNGKTLDGWTQKNGTATYEVDGGTILGRTSEGSPNSFLCSEKDYGDFELKFEVKVDKGLNSGVQIRSKTKDQPSGNKKNDKVGRVYGPQVEIETGPAEAGYIYGEATGLGWLTPKERLIKHDHFKNDGWNEYHVIAKGPRIQTFINGEKIEDLTHDEIYKSHPKGFIGLQVHGIRKGSGPFEVRWRNIQIKEIH